MIPTAYNGVKQLIADNPIEGLQNVLESLIDTYGVPRLLAELAAVGEAKAEHIRSNWQDAPLAGRWEKQAKQLAKLGHNLPAL